MIEPDSADPVLYAEPGSTWWPVSWGPGFALLGAGIEALSGPVHGLIWLLAGIGLTAIAAVWVQARRQVCSVRLTSRVLRQGRESLLVDDIVAIEDVGVPVGARVLGGGWTVPKRFAEVPLQLGNGNVVVAWAKNGNALRDALLSAIEGSARRTK